jgi:hypothetical protein
VLAIESVALRMLAPIMSRLVRRITFMSISATPLSIMTWMSLGMERSANTTSARKTVAKAISFLYGEMKRRTRRRSLMGL